MTSRLDDDVGLRRQQLADIRRHLKTAGGFSSSRRATIRPHEHGAQASQAVPAFKCGDYAVGNRAESDHANSGYEGSGNDMNHLSFTGQAQARHVPKESARMHCHCGYALRLALKRAAVSGQTLA